MLQKEVVGSHGPRQPGTKDYGRLTVMLAAVAEVKGLFDVGPGAFQPRPQGVGPRSCIFGPRKNPRFDIGDDGALAHPW